MAVSMKAQINASVEEVWQIISDFNSLPKFLEAAVKSELEGEGVGTIRIITLPDGAILKERLESIDNEAKTLEYSITEGPLPVENYLSKIKLTPVGDKCEIEWSSQFSAAGVDDEEAKTIISGIYQSGFDGLAKLFG